MPKQSRPPSDADADDDLQGQVDAVADQLYGLPLDEFSDARDTYIRQAREQKNPPLARELGKLRKPTQSAWLINLLWRDQREIMEQLFELASELSDAQAAAAGSALRELTQQRRQLESALLRRGAELAAQQGVRVSDSVEREAQETLSAALALPEVADEVRSGRLVKAANYAGFGAAPGSAPVRPAAPARAPIDLQAVQRARSAARAPAEADAGKQRTDTASSPRRGKAPPSEADDEAALREAEEARRREEEEAQRRREEDERRRREAERRVDAARQALAAADAEVASATRASGAAAQRKDDLRQRVETLREQLERLQAEADRAERSAADAEEARQRAETERQAVQETLRQAEREANL
jgi:hypothetical protein